MKILHSLWTKPLLKKQDRNVSDRFDGGWTDKIYNLMSWSLSCLQFGKFYNHIELYTDNYGKEILIDQLQLPYTKVHVVLDQLNHYHPDLWAIGKLYTYSQQKEPFLHVDGDAYIWERFCPELENSALIAQNLEHNFLYYKKGLIQIHQNFSFVPECIAGHHLYDESKSINAGIFGGNDIGFIQEYTQKAFEFIDKNISNLEKIDIGVFNTVYEQYLFYNLVKVQNKDIFCFDENINNDFEGLANFSGVSKYTKFIHLVGHYKKHPQTGKNIAQRLLQDYPEYYFKIIQLFKELKL